MPILKASINDVRLTKRRTLRNTANMSKIKTYIKKIEKAKTKDEIGKLLKKAIPLLDKAARKNVIHKNRAARLKSRLSLKMARTAA